MEKFWHWWKTGKETGDQRYVTLLKSLLLGLLPLVCCLVYCAVEGRTLGEVYLPASQWNDELFYYKQVEGIVHYGYPRGYFGFNESHALKLSFAAWSPVLVFPWIIWGLLFGWNLMSPVICNIVLMTLCCILFVWLVKPTWRQMGILTLLFCLYTPFVRYMLSVMPEVICFFMVIVFYSLAVNYTRREKGYKLVLLFLMSGVMTLMRPYMLLFMLLPAWFWFRRSRWKGALGSAVVLGAVLGIYGCIKHYFGAEYFTPLFFTDWVAPFFDQGLIGGIRYALGKLYNMGKLFMGHTVQGFRTGLASGAFFAGFLVCMAVAAAQSFRDWRLLRRSRKERNIAMTDSPYERLLRRSRKEQEKSGTGPDGHSGPGFFPIEVHLAFSFAAMLIALLLMYKLTEGSKHLLTFMAAAVFVISLMETRFYKKAALVGVTFAYFYSWMAADPYDYQVPFVQEEQSRAVEDWEGILQEELTLRNHGTVGYDNVVIWVFSDTVEGTSVNTRWQLLYGLPEGFGISCCMPDYVKEHLEEMESRYLFTVAGGEIDEMCRQAGYRELGRQQDSVLYERGK